MKEKKRTKRQTEKSSSSFQELGAKGISLCSDCQQNTTTLHHCIRIPQNLKKKGIEQSLFPILVT